MAEQTSVQSLHTDSAHLGREACLAHTAAFLMLGRPAPNLLQIVTSIGPSQQSPRPPHASCAQSDLRVFVHFWVLALVYALRLVD